ncbi:MAG: DUF4388 domain-containing protein [Planctomycetes bacterium]|nr:DUF4388 domain-containing protein [Planctomycetota bacterium]
MSLRGSVRAFSLEQTLEFLNSSGHAGTLSVQHKEAGKDLYLFRSGLYLERSHWSFRIGDALVRSGAISPAQLEEGLKKHKESDLRIGDALRELGFIDDDAILTARRTQVEEEIYELFGWEGAFFEFHNGELPDDFEERSEDKEEFRFDIPSVLLEVVRRQDEWSNIQDSLPSERRLYVLSSEDGALKRAGKELKGINARVEDAGQVFDGTHPLVELPHYLGLSRFEARSTVSRLLLAGDVRPLIRHELESRFRMAIRQDMDYAQRLYECALETPEFDTRGRFLDRVFFGSEHFQEAAKEEKVQFSARLSGRRAFQLLLGLFRQGVACELTVREEGQGIRLAFNKSALIWRVDEGRAPPSIVKYLLARSPVSVADLVKVRELQAQTGSSLQQILVGGGYVTMENWFRAQKDTVLNELFTVFFLKRPFVEVSTTEETGTPNPRLDIEVPLLPWLHAELMREIREWEAILAQLPSVGSYLVLTPKGERSLKGQDDPVKMFDGQRSMTEVLAAQHVPPIDFLREVHEKVQSGRIAQLDAAGYRERLEAALSLGKRGDALKFCRAAVAAHDDPDFKQRLAELKVSESEASSEATRSTLRGDLASYSLAEVLQTFHLRKSSGTLRVETNHGAQPLSRQIYIDQGDVYLLAGELGDGIATGDLEEGLVAAGLVTEDQLADAAAQQMKDEVYEMFIWEEAEFEWVVDELPPEFYTSKANRKIRLNTVMFLLGAVQRIQEWEEVRKTLPSDDLVLAFESSAIKMRIVLEKGNEDLLLLADGRHAISDLIRMSRTRRFNALRILAELVDEGLLKIVDLVQIEEDDEESLFMSDVPTSGVIEEGFVGQIQFVGTLQDMVSASLVGVLRVTDGRRSKELALIEGQVYRTVPFSTSQRLKRVDVVGPVTKELSPEAKRLAELEGTDLGELPEGLRGAIEMEMKMLRMAVDMEGDKEASTSTSTSTGDEDEDLSGLSEFELALRTAQKEQEEEQQREEKLRAGAVDAARETARDFAECFSWRGTRFELLKGTLPPRLEDKEERRELHLDGETLFDSVALAGERWVKVGELVPKDLVVAYSSDEIPDRARELVDELAEGHAGMVDLVAAKEHTAEDVARLSGERFLAMSWLAGLFEEGLAVGQEPEPAEGDDEEDWDFSL